MWSRILYYVQLQQFLCFRLGANRNLFPVWQFPSLLLFITSFPPLSSHSAHSRQVLSTQPLQIFAVQHYRFCVREPLIWKYPPWRIRSFYCPCSVYPPGVQGRSWIPIWAVKSWRACLLAERQFNGWSEAGGSHGWCSPGRQLFFGWFWSEWQEEYLEDIGVIGKILEAEMFIEGLRCEWVADVCVNFDVLLSALHYFYRWDNKL